jgi:hypothetical protein
LFDKFKPEQVLIRVEEGLRGFWWRILKLFGALKAFKKLLNLKALESFTVQILESIELNFFNELSHSTL